MNETTARRGPGWPILLLVPATLLVAKGIRRRRAMWEAGWTPSDAPGHGHGHGYGPRRGFGGPGGDPDGTFRLPPRIEATLAAWHTRVHQPGDPADTAAAPGPAPETI